MKVFYQNCDFSTLDPSTIKGDRLFKLVKILDLNGFQPVDTACEAEIVSLISEDDDLSLFAHKLIGEDWPADCSQEHQLILIDEPDFTEPQIQEIISLNPSAQICLISPTQLRHKVANAFFLEAASEEDLLNILRYADVFFTSSAIQEGYGVKCLSLPAKSEWHKIKPEDFAKQLISNN